MGVSGVGDRHHQCVGAVARGSGVDGDLATGRCVTNGVVENEFDDLDELERPGFALDVLVDVHVECHVGELSLTLPAWAALAEGVSNWFGVALAGATSSQHPVNDGGELVGVGDDALEGGGQVCWIGLTQGELGLGAQRCHGRSQSVAGVGGERELGGVTLVQACQHPVQRANEPCELGVAGRDGKTGGKILWPDGLGVLGDACDGAQGAAGEDPGQGGHGEDDGTQPCGQEPQEVSGCGVETFGVDGRDEGTGSGG